MLESQIQIIRNQNASLQLVLKVLCNDTIKLTSQVTIITCHIDYNIIDIMGAIISPKEKAVAQKEKKKIIPI